MRILVLGGTVFVSRAVAAEAVGRGHEVVCAARGTSGPAPDGARLVRVDRDDPATLAAVDGAFDAVVDPALQSLRWVRDALAAFRDRAGHWTFVSSISVYADEATRGQTVGAPTVAPVLEETDDREAYGGVKVASEQAVLAAGPALVVRAGLVVGPGDGSDRFGYWPARLARGGRVLVPADAPAVPAQWVDVRDLAAWVVDCAERGATGTHDVIGPATTLGAVLAVTAELLAPAGTELVPVPFAWLAERGVRPWSGPRSLPLWMPPETRGVVDHDAAPVRAAGLRTRPLAETVQAAFEHEVALGTARERRSGLAPGDEAELLAEWQAGPAVERDLGR